LGGSPVSPEKLKAAREAIEKAEQSLEADVALKRQKLAEK